MKSIVLATNNPGKIKDYQTLLKDLPLKLIPQSEFQVPEIAETGLTFVENALLKARNACIKTGLPSLGDDSGLVVDALHGAPGLYSARYAGENATMDDNIQKVLEELDKLENDSRKEFSREGSSREGSSRKARFYSVIVLLQYPDDPAPLICEGSWEGEILHKRQGHEGFGYLPIFYVPTHQCSGAELSVEERTKINHRGQAFRKLVASYFQKYEY